MQNMVGKLLFRLICEGNFFRRKYLSYTPACRTTMRSSTRRERTTRGPTWGRSVSHPYTQDQEIKRLVSTSPCLCISLFRTFVSVSFKYFLFLHLKKKSVSGSFFLSPRFLLIDMYSGLEHSWICYRWGSEHRPSEIYQGKVSSSREQNP